MNSWTIIKLLSRTEYYFSRHCIDSPRLTAELLLAHTLDIKRIDLYLQHDRLVNKNELSNFKTLIKKRLENQPIAYIIGEKGFYNSDFYVTKDVLIPRPDTEIIVEQALKILNHTKKSCNVFEPGTGSGAIIISIAKEIPDNNYYANDCSFDALDIAEKNAKKIFAKTITFFCADWFSSLSANAQFDLIISNPPYIPSQDIAKLAPEIRKYEPLRALDGGKDGLDCFKDILKKAYKYLVPKGVILLETGFDQKKELINIVNQYSQYKSVEFIKDFAGHNRVALIKKI